MTDVIRPVTRLDSDQQAALDDAIEAARAADELEDKVWKLIEIARKKGVPDLTLCERTGRSRSTLNRKLGRRKDKDA